MKNNRLEVEGLEIRYSTQSDLQFLVRWLSDPKVLRGFPLKTEQEIQQSAEYWISFHRCQASLTAEFSSLWVQDLGPVSLLAGCQGPLSAFRGQLWS